MKKEFDSEFKKKSVVLSYIKNNVTELAAELGIDSASLYRWRRVYKNAELIHFFQQNSSSINALERENERLQNLIEEAKREREILKSQLMT